MINAKGYAAQTPTTNLAPWNFERREVGPVIEFIITSVCNT